LLKLGTQGNVFHAFQQQEEMPINCCQLTSETVFVLLAAKVWDCFPSVVAFDRTVMVQKRATSLRQQVGTCCWAQLPLACVASRDRSQLEGTDGQSPRAVSMPALKPCSNAWAHR